MTNVDQIDPITRRASKIATLAVILSVIAVLSLVWVLLAEDAPWPVHVASVPAGVVIGWALVRGTDALETWFSTRRSR